MKLRTKKRLLNGCSLLLLASAATIATLAWKAPGPPVDVVHRRIGSVPSASPPPAAPAIAAGAASWQRVLRRPLYDPPPPPKKEVVVEPRPIRVQLSGTILEPNNSQAFIRQPNGKVELKRKGDQLTSDRLDGIVAEITANEIVIRRDDGDHRLGVEGNN